MRPEGGFAQDFERTSSDKSRRYIPEIDALRALAVALVLGFHAFPKAVPGGFIGVDVFFVISGFVITRAYLGRFRDGTVTFAGFFEARFRRLLPALVFTLVVTTFCAFLILVPDELVRYGKSLLAQPFYVQNFVFWREGLYFEGALEKPLLHTWSLAVEEQFYLCFGLALILLARFPKLLLVSLIVGMVVEWTPFHRTGGGWVYALRRRNSRGERNLSPECGWTSQ